MNIIYLYAALSVLCSWYVVVNWPTNDCCTYCL